MNKKLLSFLIALSVQIPLSWMEIVLTPLSGWELAPVAAMVAAIGAGRLYLFYEGTALKEIGLEKARTAFRMSIAITVAFALYIVCLKFFVPEHVDWYRFSLFQLGNLTLLFVEWVFSQRQGAEAESLIFRLTEKAEKAENHARNLAESEKRNSEKAELLAKQKAELTRNWFRLARKAVAYRQELRESEADKKRLFEAADSVFAQNSAFAESRGMQSEAELRAEFPPQKSGITPESKSGKRENSAFERAESGIEKAESAWITPETIAELRAEFPEAKAEIEKVSAFPDARKAKNRRDYLRKKESEGSLNGEATEYEILKRLTL